MAERHAVGCIIALCENKLIWFKLESTRLDEVLGRVYIQKSSAVGGISAFDRGRVGAEIAKCEDTTNLNVLA